MGPAWAGITFWMACLGFNCVQMASGGAESDFGLWGWIDTLGLKQIFLIFSVIPVMCGDVMCGEAQRETESGQSRNDSTVTGVMLPILQRLYWDIWNVIIFFSVTVSVRPSQPHTLPQQGNKIDVMTSFLFPRLPIISKVHEKKGWAQPNWFIYYILTLAQQTLGYAMGKSSQIWHLASGGWGLRLINFLAHAREASSRLTRGSNDREGRLKNSQL